MALFGRRKTIYYPGTTLSKYFPEIVLNYKSLLSDYGVSYELVEDLYTGWSLFDQGYADDFNEHLVKLRERLETLKAKTVITSSPEALYILRRFCPEVNAKHTTTIIHENLAKVQRFNNGEACFHDNTTQTRRNHIIEEPRDILRKAGFDLTEFVEHKTDTQCLGTSTALINNSPRLATKLAQRRIRLAPSKTIITDSPEDYLQLKRTSNADVHELSEVLVEI